MSRREEHLTCVGKNPLAAELERARKLAVAILRAVRDFEHSLYVVALQRHVPD